MFSLVIPGGVANAEPTNGSLTIHKFEQEPGAPQGNPDGSKLDNPPVGKALEGVTFTLTQTHKYDPANDKWTEYTGEPFTRVTDENGRIKIDNISLGRYKVQETAGPPHVNLNKKEYYVDIPMTSKDGSDLNYNVHIYPKNETIRGAVKLIKKDGDTKKGLGGVTFDLFKENGELVESGLTTNSRGYLTVDGLGYGKYIFQETATAPGYLLNGASDTFKIEKSNKTVMVYMDNFKEPEIEKSVDKSAVNRGEIVTYTLKLTLPGDIKDYINFNVTDVLHENLEYVPGSQSDPSGFDFKQNGQILTWTGNPKQLTPGEVTITFQAKIKEDAPANEPINNKATIDYGNAFEHGGKKDSNEIIVTPTVGGLVVIKQDGSNKKRLEGAVFELRQGNKVVATETTNSDGIIDFGELDYGEYELVETKAPADYRKLTNPINVLINSDKSEHEIIVDNYKSSWELPKTGGMGTLFFTLIGLTFMGSALYMYIRRRRADV